jgi:hypothetical protein
MWVGRHDPVSPFVQTIRVRLCTRIAPAPEEPKATAYPTNRALMLFPNVRKHILNVPYGQMRIGSHN